MGLQKRLNKIIYNRKTIMAHVLSWAMFITYEMSYLYTVNQTLGAISGYAVRYLINIVLFYTNVWCLTNSFGRKKKSYLYVFYVLAELIVYIFIHFIVTEIFNGFKWPFPTLNLKFLIIGEEYRAIYFIGLSAVYALGVMMVKSDKLLAKMQSRRLLQQRKRLELERNLIKTENAYLTSQINPHLLFNTLNFIYNNLNQVSEKAAESVMLLSDMMRYSLTAIGEDGMVELEQEIEHIRNMVQLNQARFDDNLNIELEFEGYFQVRIIPLILLTFIENVFKHGDLTHADDPATIHISCIDGHLHFIARNKIRTTRRALVRGSGIGIKNSVTRLDAFYGGRYTLSNSLTDESHFTVELDLNLS